ncbi:MAG: hypothetical protein HYS33_08385, partial [Acidobacteria bacterium]|nr:hypothetical protein [Acidobacteriota bacterium]
MNSASPERAAHFEWRWLALCPLALGLGCAAVLLAARPLALLVLAGCSAYAVLAAISIRRPNIFITLFLAVVIALPPFYFSAFGETPVYVSTLLLPMGIGILLVRLPDLRLRLDPIEKGLLLFLIGTGLSLPFAWWLSGEVVGKQSLLRWLMLAQAAFMYFLVRGTSRLTRPNGEQRIVPILLLAALATAGFGIVDFYWPLNLPHPAADQFIWLRSAIVRRAQGTFFEAGNFANMCGVFLVLASAAFLARRERAVGMSRPWLLLSVVALSLAVFLSFTRSTWASVAVALLVFAAVSPEMKMRRALGFVASLAIPLAVLWRFSPELWNYLISARIGELAQIFVEPNVVSSGRLETWGQV